MARARLQSKRQDLCFRGESSPRVAMPCASGPLHMVLPSSAVSVRIGQIVLVTSSPQTSVAVSETSSSLAILGHYGLARADSGGGGLLTKVPHHLVTSFPPGFRVVTAEKEGAGGSGRDPTDERDACHFSGVTGHH